jgi:hypothetical protein
MAQKPCRDIFGRAGCFEEIESFGFHLFESKIMSDLLDISSIADLGSVASGWL